jgi:hypothetical protein
MEMVCSIHLGDVVMADFLGVTTWQKLRVRCEGLLMPLHVTKLNWKLPDSLMSKR